MKVCTKCGVEKSFDDFNKQKTSKDGYHSNCIECRKLRNLELKKNPLMQLEKQIRSSVILENKLLQRENKRLCTGCKEIFLIDDLLSGYICKECSTKKEKERYEKDKEKIKEKSKEHYERNKERNKERKREYDKEHYEKNKEKRRDSGMKYYEKNKEEINAQKREYRLKKKLERIKNE